MSVNQLDRFLAPVGSGRFVPGADQPLEFSEPMLLMDNNGVCWGHGSQKIAEIWMFSETCVSKESKANSCFIRHFPDCMNL